MKLKIDEKNELVINVNALFFEIILSVRIDIFCGDKISFISSVLFIIV